MQRDAIRDLKQIAVGPKPTSHGNGWTSTGTMAPHGLNSEHVT
jgi:hypothetical protein